MQSRVSAARPLVGHLFRRLLGESERCSITIATLASSSLSSPVVTLTPWRSLHTSTWCSRSPAQRSSPSTANPQHPSARQQLVCPECGKRFLRENILRDHRRARHLVNLPTPEEEAQAAVEEEIKSLKEQLRGVHERIKALKSSTTRTEASSALDSTSANSKQAQGTKGKRSGGPDDKGITEDDDVPYPAVKVHGRILANVSDRVLYNWETRHPSIAIGTSLSTWVGVGTVVAGTARLGTLEGFHPTARTEAPAVIETQESKAPHSQPRVLQFHLETLGYQERRPGQLKLFRNRVVVRYIFPEDVSTTDLFTVRSGDLLRVQGNYAQHKTYDAVSKSFVENPVVEADVIGLLKRGDVGPSEGVSPTKEAGQAMAAKADDEIRSLASVSTASALQTPSFIFPQAEGKRPKRKTKKTKKTKKKTKKKTTGKRRIATQPATGR